MSPVDLPPTLTMGPACDLLGISTWQGYQLVKRDEFPVPVLHLGRAIRVPTRPLLDLLGIEGAADAVALFQAIGARS